ncbi:MAG TPA: winged helix-turn-helix domain-containing protein [Candidatus Saccharimonadales bacterium]
MNILYNSSQLDTILDALANKKRRHIIHILALNPGTISYLGLHTELSLPAIHKHMRILERADLIIRKKSGRTNFVALNSKTLGLVQNWIGQYKTNWGNPEASLSNYISRMQE